MKERFGLSEKVIISIQKIFAAYPAVEQAIIYGSRAKGTHKPGSDIDLTLVVTKEGVLDLTIQFQIEEDLEELMLPYQFDLSIRESIENQNLIEHINRVGEVFYDKSGPRITGHGEP